MTKIVNVPVSFHLYLTCTGGSSGQQENDNGSCEIQFWLFESTSFGLVWFGNNIYSQRDNTHKLFQCSDHEEVDGRG